jgi:hypothetical protein
VYPLRTSGPAHRVHKVRIARGSDDFRRPPES